jgi:opacity protein-like surface antigen
MHYKKNIGSNMRFITAIALTLTSQMIAAATPIEGWYTSIFGGYAYLPNYINTNHGGFTRNNINNQSGYEAGGNLGFRGNLMRYEVEVSYLNAHISSLAINQVPQTGVSGYNNAVLGMANVYHDFPFRIAESLEPFLGFGIGYAWIQAQLNATGPTFVSHFDGANSAFAYQAMAGITYNFAENYSLNLNYRYIATTNVPELGQMFQAHIANVGATYRFDGNNYK